jgi:hypothetical protein
VTPEFGYGEVLNYLLEIAAAIASNAGRIVRDRVSRTGCEAVGCTGQQIIQQIVGSIAAITNPNVLAGSRLDPDAASLGFDEEIPPPTDEELLNEIHALESQLVDVLIDLSRTKKRLDEIGVKPRRGETPSIARERQVLIIDHNNQVAARNQLEEEIRKKQDVLDERRRMRDFTPEPIKPRL